PTCCMALHESAEEVNRIPRASLLHSRMRSSNKYITREYNLSISYSICQRLKYLMSVFECSVFLIQWGMDNCAISKCVSYVVSFGISSNTVTVVKLSPVFL